MTDTKKSNKNQEELPNIRQVIFYLDPANKRNYSFDVNQTITMYNLKRMLVAASNVAKVGLRIYHKQTEVEYTKYNEETLIELFKEKDWPVVEFIIKIDPSFRDEQDYKKLKLGETCPIHPHKYCFFYDFDAEKSLCSLCLTNGQYKGHNIVEKQDYLQPSTQIVDYLFHDMDDILNNIDKTHHKDTEDYKYLLKMNYFPSLVELLRKIEAKCNAVIDNYNKHCEVSFSLVHENSNKLKKHCVEGVEELKQKVDIENMMRDEGVFLHFDYKVKELSSEKVRIIQDAKKLEKINKSFVYIKERLTGVYLEIKEFLEGVLVSDIYKECNDRTIDITIEEINKDDIINRLLSDLKKKNGKVISDKKSMKKSVLNYNNANSNNDMLDTSKFNLMEIFKDQNNADNNILNKNSANNIINNNNNNINNLNDNNDDNQNNKTNVNNSMISESNNENTKLIKHDTITITKVLPNSQSVVIYADDEYESSVFDKKVSFKHLSINQFLQNSAYVNTGNSLYISGGCNVHNTANNIFLLYNPIKNHLEKLASSHTSKYNHSLIKQNDYIYSIGGYKTNTCEKYDVKANKWYKIASMLLDERQNSVLYIHNNWLYVMFGYKTSSYIDSIERLNLRSTKAKWENVVYKNPDKIDLKIEGAGICTTDVNNSEVYLIGGKNSNGIKSDVCALDFSTMTFRKCDFTIDENAYFTESNFLSLKDGQNHALYNNAESQLLKLSLV